MSSCSSVLVRPSVLFLSLAFLLTSLLVSAPLRAENEIRVQLRAAAPGDLGVPLRIDLEHDLGAPSTGELSAFQFGLVHDPSRLDFVDFEFALPEILSLDAAFVNAAVQPGTPYLGVSVLLLDTSSSPFQIVPIPPGQYELGSAIYDVDPGALAGTTVVRVDTLPSSPPLDPLFVDDQGVSFVPVSEAGGISVRRPIAIEDRVWVPCPGDETVRIIDPPFGVSLTASVAPALGPAAIAIAPTGLGWVVNRDSDSIQRLTFDGLPFGGPLSPCTGDLFDVASDPIGDVWFSCSDAGGGLGKVGASGVLLIGTSAPGVDGNVGPVISLGGNAGGLACDPLGNVWVTVPGVDQLRKYDAQGFLARVVSLPAGSQPGAISIDPHGFLWVGCPGTGVLERRRSDGALVESFAIPNIDAIAIRGRDEAWVAADQGWRVRPGEAPEAVVGSGDPTAVAIDGNGKVWFCDVLGAARRFDPGLTLEQTVPVGPGAGFRGDGSGLAVVNVLRDEEDSDGDELPNRFEIDEGSNPLSIFSVPPVVPEVFALTCTSLGRDALLTWDVPSPGTPLAITTIEVERDGVVIATLGGGGESFFDVDRDPGSYLYAVRGFIGANAGEVQECTVQIGAGGLIEVHPIGNEIGSRAANLFDICSDPGAPPIGPAHWATDIASGRIYVLDRDFLILDILDSPFPDDVPAAGIAFRPGPGMRPGTLILTSGGDLGTPTQIAEIDRDGALVTLPGSFGLIQLEEGGVPWFGPGGPITWGVNTGTIIGVEPESELIFAISPSAMGSVGPIFGYSGLAGAPTGVAALPSQLNTAAADTTEDLLFTGVSATTGGFVIDRVRVENLAVGGVPTIDAISTIELDAIDERENAFAGITFLEGEIAIVGATESVVYEVSGERPFRRGDANDDGNVNIADAISMLGYQFTEGQTFGCEDAFDANDDGNRDIGDAIYLLNHLFNQEDAPPAPFTVLGLDPTPDQLFCVE